MRRHRAFQWVFNRAEACADRGRAIRAAVVVSGAVSLFLAIIASLAPRVMAVPQ
jgi:hypothetical protein